MRFKLKIKTLSSIHIAKGENLEINDYWINNGVYYRLNIDRIYLKIFGSNPNNIKFFNDWINHKVYNASSINTHVRNIDKKLSVFDFIVESLKDKKLEDEIKKGILTGELALYEFKVNAVTSKQISELMKTPGNEAYLPGSSIKGLLRNALLNYTIYINQEDARISKILRSIFSKNPRDLRKKDRNELEEYCFNAGYSRNNNENFNDAKFDIFKFIKVTDSTSLPSKDTCHLAELNLLFSNGKIQGQLPGFEVINPNSEFEATLDINISALKAVSKYFLTTNERNRRNWVKLDKVLKLSFGIENKDIIEKEESEIAEIIIKRINNSIENLSLQLINLDSLWWGDKKGYADEIEKFPDNSLKIGFGSGFYATTIYSSVLDEEYNNIDKKHLKSFYNLLLKRTRRKNENNNYNEQIPLEYLPKTRHIEIIGKNNYKPFGWISVEII